MAGALPSRWVECAEGEVVGGAPTEIERQYAEVALQHGDTEEPSAVQIPVRAVDPGDGGGVDREKVWHPSGQELGGPPVGAARNYPAKGFCHPSRQDRLAG